MALTGIRQACRRNGGTRGASSPTMAGAHSPTNPIGPATVTAAAVSRTAEAASARRLAPTRTPRLRATSSPSASRSRFRCSTSATSKADGDTGSTCTTPSRPRWLSEPEPHANSPRVSWVFRIISDDVTLARPIASTVPASTSRRGDPPPRVMASRTAAAASPPKKAMPTPPRMGSGHREHSGRDKGQVGARLDGERVGGGERVPRETLQHAAARAQRDPDRDGSSEARPS